MDISQDYKLLYSNLLLEYEKLKEEIIEYNAKLKDIESRRMKLGQKLNNNENEEDALLFIVRWS